MESMNSSRRDLSESCNGRGFLFRRDVSMSPIFTELKTWTGAAEGVVRRAGGQHWQKSALHPKMATVQVFRCTSRRGGLVSCHQGLVVIRRVSRGINRLR